MMRDEAHRLFQQLFGGKDFEFFLMPVCVHFADGPYHEVTVCGSWDAERLARDFSDKVMRSTALSEAREAEAQDPPATQRLLVQLGKDEFLHLEKENLTVSARTQEAANAQVRALSDRYLRPKKEAPPGFYLLRTQNGGMSTERVSILRPYIQDTNDLMLHYGEDAIEFEEGLVAALRSRSQGATILRGPPGTGKTSFIRHLVAKLQSTHRFYFLPKYAEQALTSVNMVEFWVRESQKSPNTGKVVILEDAEELIMNRECDNRSQVSGLLNIADGLLGEFLNVHLICTVNCEIEKLDPAIVRPGRLVGIREFRRLNRAESDRLAATKGIKLREQNDYSLAEIYALPVIGTLPSVRQIQGFAA